MLTLQQYIKENPQEESVIAEIFHKTGCDYSNLDISYDWDLDKSISTYTLKEGFLEYNEMYILKEEDSYLIFSISENRFDKPWVYHKTREKVKDLEEVILIEAIYSFSKNKKLATKNIQKLQEIANDLQTEILVDTYTPQLVHLAQKLGLNILKESSLDKKNWISPD